MKNSIVVLLVFVDLQFKLKRVKNKNAKIEFHVSGNCEMCKGSKSGIGFRVKSQIGIWTVVRFI
jgi:hypothetical protein